MANQPSELDIMLDNLQAAGGVTHYLVYNREGATRQPGRARGAPRSGPRHRFPRLWRGMCCDSLAYPGMRRGGCVGGAAGVPLRWAGWKNTAADYNRVVQTAALVSKFSTKSSQYVRELLRPGEVQAPLPCGYGPVFGRSRRRVVAE